MHWVTNIFGFLALAWIPLTYVLARHFWPLMVDYARAYDASQGTVPDDDEPEGEFALLYGVHRYHYASLRRIHHDIRVEEARRRALPWYRALLVVWLGGFTCCSLLFILDSGT
jgi:hypothetical protein